MIRLVSPLTGVVGPLPNGLNGLYIGVTNYLLTGMILQVKVPFLYEGVVDGILVMLVVC